MYVDIRSVRYQNKDKIVMRFDTTRNMIAVGDGQLIKVQQTTDATDATVQQCNRQQMQQMQ